jgi:3-methyladenine DNA glycosylase AlkC
MSERAERQPFKLHFGPALVDDLAERIRAVYPVFPVNAFRAEVAPRLDPLELKGRVAAIAAGLRQQLPSDYPTALGILLQILGPPLRESEGMFVDSWYLMPVATFVEQYGLDHPAASLAAMHTITQRHTAEFAIRPFLLRHPEATLAALRDWVHDESFHVRRLVSEGTRGRLPWGANLPAFIADPTPVLALLEALRDDPSAYVRRSVANNLNGIARDHPELLIRTLRRWRENASPERLRLIQHALRTLVKAGHPEALALLGAAAPQIELLAFSVAPERLRIGEAVIISARIEVSHI